MILTVTTRTTLDIMVSVPAFVPDTVMRATTTAYSMGGKPTDASYVLATLGIPSRALGFAAGPNGQRVEQMLIERGVTTDFIWVDGETRLSLVIVSEDSGDMSTITTATMSVRPEHVAELRRRYTAALADAPVLVIGGTTPEGANPPLYEEMILEAKAAGVPVIFDGNGEAQRDGMRGCPDYAKPNWHELGDYLGRRLNSIEDVYAAAREVFDRSGTSMVVSMDSQGALAVLPDRAYYIPPLPIEVVSASGAGDAMLAGMAAGIARGEPIEEGLRLGVAAASAVCLMPGTADCRPEDVERLLPQVELRLYP